MPWGMCRWVRGTPSSKAKAWHEGVGSRGSGAGLTVKPRGVV